MQTRLDTKISRLEFLCSQNQKEMNSLQEELEELQELNNDKRQRLWSCYEKG